MAPKPPAKPPLTPSETVYFHAPDFARDAVTPDAVEVAASDEKVRATDLAVTLLAAAILADERAGALRLEPGERKDALFLRPAQGSVFPAGSPEAKVREAAAKVATPDVESVVRAYLAKDADKPFEAVVGKVEEGLARRGLLAADEGSPFALRRPRPYSAPEDTLRLARAAPPDDALDLLDATRRSRPEVWALLDEGIRAGIQSRRDRRPGKGNG